MADINVGLKVDGLSGFKSAMNQGKQAVKTLDAELKLNAAQFKASGNAEEYMSNKAKLLKQQIAEQEAVVKAATDALAKMEEKGIKKSSTAYQTMAANVAQAKTRLVEMQNSLNGLGNELSDTGNQARGLGGELADIGNNVSSLNKKDSLSKLSSALGAVEDKAKAVVTGIINIGKKFWQLEVDASYWADDILTRATQYEMDTTTLQQWEYAARFVDTSVESIVGARKRLLNKMPKDGSNIISLGELGDIIYEGETIDDVFWNVLETVGQMDDALVRDQYAQQLFGKSWDELLPLLTAGREAWEGFMDEAPVLTEDQVKTLGEANDAYERMQAQIETLKGEVAVGFAPAFQAISESVTNLLGTFSEWLQTDEGQAVLNRFTEAVTTFLDSITEEDMQNIVNTLATGFETALGWISDIIENIDAIGPGLVAAFALLEGSSAFINVLSLINSLKGLFGNGGTPTVPTTPTSPTAPTAPITTGIGTKLLSGAKDLATNPLTWTAALAAAIVGGEMSLIEDFENDPELMRQHFGVGNELTDTVTEGGTETQADKLANLIVDGIMMSKNGESYTNEWVDSVDETMSYVNGEFGHLLQTLDVEEFIYDAFGMWGGSKTGMAGLWESFANAYGEEFANTVMPIVEAEYTKRELYNSVSEELSDTFAPFISVAEKWQRAQEQAEAKEEGIPNAIAQAIAEAGQNGGFVSDETIAALGEQLTTAGILKSPYEILNYINDSFDENGQFSLDLLKANILEDYEGNIADTLIELFTAATESASTGVTEMDGTAYMAGLSLGAAAVAGFNAAYGGMLGAGGAKPTPSFANGNGPIYNGGNLYVGAMTMNNGMDAAALLGTMNAANRRASAGHGG